MKVVRLGQVLVDEKIITEDQLNLALERQKTVKKRLGNVISDMGMASERDILRALAKRLQVEYVDTPLFQIELDSIRLIPEHLARKYNIVPLNMRAGIITIATNDPLDFTCLEDLGIITGMEIRTVVSSSIKIEKAINRVYTRQNADEILNDIRDEYGVSAASAIENADDESMAERVDSAPVVKLVNNLIFDAFQQNASDIHIEPEDNLTRVRYRIDGDLQLHNEFSADVHQLIITRIKIISGMNIAEKRIPQDGSFQFKSEFFTFDIRVSSLPTAYGEKIVLRLLGADRNIDYNLSSLGLSPYTQEIIQKAIKLPHGILLVTGPTGSGKTTTLYSMLAQLADIKKAIVTIEDPIERKFRGITRYKSIHGLA